MATVIENLRPLDSAAREPALRRSEWLVLAFLLYAGIASLLFPLTGLQRSSLLAMNAAAATIMVLLARRTRELDERRESESFAGRRAAWSALRDWLPCFLIVLAYHESALFSLPRAHHPLNQVFERWDTALLANTWSLSLRAAASPWLDAYLEFSYLLCYPVVPLAFAVVYFRSRRLDPQAAREAFDRFWTGVLLALLSSYGLFPFFPLTTPRLMFHDLPLAYSHSVFRRLNLWLLAQFGGAGAVFPSGHVAGATAVALSVRQQSRRWGAAFIVIGSSIAAATVVERYHYAADALAGMLIATAAVLLADRFITRPRAGRSEGTPARHEARRN